ncbi:MAG: aminoacyl-tRNA hydrolase [Bacillota bacterium]|nr:aminoacyl-tRNA hydrolase [Bacillota bacterium]
MGLGNSGERYRLTRHNLGAWVVEGLSRRWDIPLSRRVGGGLIGLGRVGAQKVGLFFPLTFMNLSGAAVGQAVTRLGLVPADLLLIHDDLDLEAGRLRMRPAGGSGGHRGVESVILALGTEDIPRLRVGIGRPPADMDPADFVLAPMSEEEVEFYRIVVEKAVEGCALLLERGLDVAMGWVNSADASAG